MKLALECRTDMLEMVQPFADYDFLLAHKVLQDEKYCNYYKESDRLKFVDNSVNELGQPLSLEQMKEAFEKVGGTYIVSPDFIGDFDKTAQCYQECSKIFKGRTVGVVQGRTYEECFRCLGQLDCNIVAIPYDICSKKTDPPWLMGLRRALFVSNIPRIEGRVIHLLGFTSMEELYWYKDDPFIKSIDTGAPILLGLEGLDILDPLESKEQPTFNRMEKIELTQKGWTAIIRNIALLRKEL